MGVKDLIVTPVYLIFIYLVAYLIKPQIQNNLRSYFIPGLTVRFFGAISIGVIYQFYYSGGDTFNFYHHGSVIWDAFLEDPKIAFKLIFYPNPVVADTFQYTSRMYWTDDPSSYFICRIAGLLGIITFNTYSSIALFFALLSFSGLWALFRLFCELTWKKERILFIGILLFPSIVFWGSGVMKDTIAISSLCWLFVSFYRSTNNKFIIRNVVILVISFLVLLIVKVYIIAAVIPAFVFYSYIKIVSRIKNPIKKYLLIPLIVVALSAPLYFILNKVGEINPKYSLERIPQTAQITAYDIAFWTGRDAGSTYSLGVLDGTWSNMLSLFPAGVNVALFRPYLWEVRNPLMFLSAVESLFLFCASLYFFIRFGWPMRTFQSQPIIAFCLLFTVIFAFAIGVSTFNFGSLVRYRIPLIPFYLIGLIMHQYYWQASKYSTPIKHA